MQDFFDDARRIKRAMEEMQEKMLELERLHEENLAAISTEQGRQFSEQLEEVTQSTNAITTGVRNQLKAMDEDNKEHALRYQTNPEVASESRIRANTHGSLTRKFVKAMSEYQDLQTKYKKKYRKRVERQYKIVKPEATQEEIEDSISNPQADVFMQQMAGVAAAQNALADIQDRHKDIMRLETSINEVHQLFMDMSMLVEAQGGARCVGRRRGGGRRGGRRRG